MAICFHRLRRALPLSSSLFHLSIHLPNPLSSPSSLSNLLSASTSPTTISTISSSQLTRTFTSTTTLLLADRRKVFDPETDEIGPDTILFEGCDYNHWLITVEFPKDSNFTREQKIDFYINIAAQIFGSVEEAKKKIYALSTTTYGGFQVECSEETSNKFQSIPGVVFVLPDSYIDPVNKEYGGDKYVNGEIFPQPPPVHYGRRSNRDRRPREQMPYQQGNAVYSNQGTSNSETRNYGQKYGPPPQQRNFGPPPPQQNFGPPPPQRNFGPPPPQQNYGAPLAQPNYDQPPQQANYRQVSPQPNYGQPSPQPNYDQPSPQLNYGPPSLQPNYGQQQQNYGQPPQQNYNVRPTQQDYAPPPAPSQQNYGQPRNFPPQENHGPPDSGERSSHMASNTQGNYNAQGQRDFQQGYLQNHVPPEHQNFSVNRINKSIKDIIFEQGSERNEDQAARTAFAQNQPKQGEDQRFPQMEQRNFSSLSNS